MDAFPISIFVKIIVLLARKQVLIFFQAELFLLPNDIIVENRHVVLSEINKKYSFIL